MHYLHPRSSSTSTLFTTTLAISFLVVGLPHLLPCPVDRRKFADSTADGKTIGRRSKGTCDGMPADGPGIGQEGTGMAMMDSREARPARECPVPKPSGLVGSIMDLTWPRAEVKRESLPEVVVVKQELKKSGQLRREEREQRP